LTLTDQARFLLLVKSASGSHDDLKKIAIARSPMADTLANAPDGKVTDVVFVIAMASLIRSPLRHPNDRRHVAHGNRAWTKRQSSRPVRPLFLFRHFSVS
jgi:hypothetical protein